MSQVFQQTAIALGSEVLLTINLDASAGTAQTIFDELWQAIHDFDDRFSRFKTDSELSLLNQQAGDWLTVSTPMIAILTETKKMAELTAGLFNPFILPALQRAGYVKSWTPNPTTLNPPDYSNRQMVTWDKLKIKNMAIRMPSDSALDLGGIGKGYLLDQLGDILKTHQVANYWLSLGGDILFMGVDDDNKPWSIAIADAVESSKNIAFVESLPSRPLAIATSGITKRQGVYNGRAWHHIIDPKTGLPAQTDLLTATVVMSSATKADILASCLVTLGYQASNQFMDEHNIEDVLLQTSQKSKLIGKRIVLL